MCLHVPRTRRSILQMYVTGLLMGQWTSDAQHQMEHAPFVLRHGLMGAMQPNFDHKWQA